jgi:excisionase family DNA binding protein
MSMAERADVKLDGHDLILPRQALALLRDLLSEMAQGNAVTIVPTHAELTTQEAANILNVSRPYLIKLLEEGEIAHHKVNKHRRIRFDDLMAYKRQQALQSSQALNELAQQTQKLSMY